VLDVHLAPLDAPNDTHIDADLHTAVVDAANLYTADVHAAEHWASDERAGNDTAQETLTTPQFEALLAVQDLDTAIDQRRHGRANLPEQAELAAVDSQLAAVERRLVDAAARRDEVAARQDGFEAELMATEARIAEVNKRLYGGTVSASRELLAMASDVKSMEARASGLEERALEMMEEREPLDAEVAAIEEENASLLAARAEIEERLAMTVAEIDVDMDALNHRRADAVTGVPDQLLGVYTRLRDRLGGVGAARLMGSSCGGCHLMLPATELDQLKHQPPDAVVFCDQCGRILVR
jgi:predicted  nucleic acid-binding Zn-ribbon protein